MIGKIKQGIKWLKETYRASAENRLQIHLFLGFILIPVIGMSLLFIYEFFYVLK